MRLRPFELALVLIFGALAFFAIFLLSTYEPKQRAGETIVEGEVSIWGTLPAAAFASLLSSLAEGSKSFSQVSYRYVPPASFDAELINALAERRAPQLILLPHERLVQHRTKIQPLSYDWLPQRDFRDRYIDAAELFALHDGVYALPLMLDPIVMYWNRDLLSNAGFLSAPTSWEQVVGQVAPALTIRDFDRTVRRSTVAMGEYHNVKNAFPILSMLAIQGGSRLVPESARGYEMLLNSSAGGGEPLTNALTFFMRFSNTSSDLYSWNRSLPLDQDAFLREDLALYFGFGSEARELAAKNPNLNFDMAEVPQGAAATLRRTYGTVYGLAAVRGANNIGSALLVMNVLSGETNAKRLADAYNMAPVHRRSLAAGSNDTYGRIIYMTAPIARGWLNPEKRRAEEIMAAAVADVASGRADARAAVSDATNRLRQAY